MKPHRDILRSLSELAPCLLLVVLFSLLLPLNGWTHGEVSGGGEQKSVQKVQTRNGTYRIEMMHSPAQPVAGEPANIELKVVRLLPKPDPLLGSEVPVGLPPEALLLSARTQAVLDPHLPVHAEGEAGIFGVAEYRFPPSGPFLVRWLIPQSGSFLVRFVIHTEAGDQFNVDLPVTAQPDMAAFFRVWVNLALCGLILGLTGMQLGKVRSAGGGLPRMLRPIVIGAVSLLAVLLPMNFFGLDRVLAMRKPKVAAGATEAVTANEDGSYTIPDGVQKDLGLVLVAAKQMPLEQAITAYGTIEANPASLAEVFAPLWGRIEYPDKPLAVGDRVERGKELVRITLELSAIERAPMEAKQKDIKGALAQARERKDAAQFEYDRAQKLAAANPAFEQDLKWAKELLDEANDAYEQIAKQDLGYVGVIKFRDPRKIPVAAPISGTIATIDFVPGQLNLNGEYRKLFTIVDTTQVWVRGQIYLSDVWKLKAGQAVQVFPEGASSRAITGAVRWIGDSVDPANRTVPVILTVPNPDRRVALGSFARIEFPQRKRAVAVPEQAVVDDGTTRRVYVARDQNRFEALAVELGVKRDGWWQVLSGLQEGDRVIAKGAGLLGSLRQEEAPVTEPRQTSLLSSTTP